MKKPYKRETSLGSLVVAPISIHVGGGVAAGPRNVRIILLNPVTSLCRVIRMHGSGNEKDEREMGARKEKGRKKSHVLRMTARQAEKKTCKTSILNSISTNSKERDRIERCRQETERGGRMGRRREKNEGKDEERKKERGDRERKERVTNENLWRGRLALEITGTSSWYIYTDIP